MKAFLRFFIIFCFINEFGITFASERAALPYYVNYINRHSNMAVKNEVKYKIPASITLAQGILESGAGLSELAILANNHFGIKCHASWTGDRVVYADDTPYDNFRKYPSVEDSYNDHAEFLLRNPRYRVLFTYDLTDYKSWARGLQECGYATDKGYANKLITIIEDYKLYEYNKLIYPQGMLSEVEAFPEVLPRIPENGMNAAARYRIVHKTHSLIYIIAEEGDSYHQIAEDTGFKLKKLLKYNDVPGDFPIKKGDIVYLEQKKKKADKPYFEHIVKVGESVHSISQLYGIRLSNLYKMNGSNLDDLYVGDVIRLR